MTQVATPVSTQTTQRRGGGDVVLIVFGVGLAVAGLAWWWLGRPPTNLADTDYVACRAMEIQRGVGEELTACERAVGPVAGPLLVAGIGAFLVLLGVILYAARRR